LVKFAPMTVELEPGRLRVGETRDKPWGGVVADTPFARALYELSVSRGYETQSALSRALNLRTRYAVGGWYVARRMPNPESFSVLLRVLKPEGDELEKLVVPWAEHVSGRGVRGTETRLRSSIRHRKQPETKVGEILDHFSRKSGLFMRECFKLLDINYKSIAVFERDASLDSLAALLERAPIRMEMSADETEELAQAVAEIISNKIEGGHKFQNSMRGKQLKNFQASLDCKTYNGEEAARKIRVSREVVRLHRKKLGLPLLMTDEQVRILRRSIRKSKTRTIAF